MKKFLFSLLFLSSSAFVFGQNNDDKTIERNDLKDFTKVSVELLADVYLRQSDSFRCRLIGEQSNIEELRATVENGELAIYRRKNNRWFGNIERVIIVIEAPNFERLEFSGVGKIIAETKLTGKNLRIEANGPINATLDSVDYQHIDIELNGVGHISIGGKAVSTTIEMNGTGSIDAYELQTQTARCETSGIGSIYCSVSEELNAFVGGIGGIKYKGTPKHLRKSVSGIGRVVSRN
jgi:hypothetical protein